MTSSASLTTGADGSEPHGTCRPTACTAGPVHCPGDAGCRVLGVPRVQGCTKVRALHGVGQVHIRSNLAVRLGQAGAGTVPGTVPITVPEPVSEQCNNGHYDTRQPDTRNPDTRDPIPAMYPGYLVTRCRPYWDLLLLYPISAKVSLGARGSPVGVPRRVYDKLLIALAIMAVLALWRPWL